MKKNIICIVFLCAITVGNSQEKVFLNEIKKQTLTIKNLKDNIQKINGKLKKKETILSNYIDNLKKANEREKLLQKKLDNLKKEKKEIDLKNAKIDSLKGQIREIERNYGKKLNEQQQQCSEDIEQRVKILKDRLVGVYKTSPFDDLIAISTQQSVTNVAKTFADYKEIQPVITDLKEYFEALKILNEKYNKQSVENAKYKLKSIKQSSKKTKQLLEKLEYYQDYTEELKLVLEKIAQLDSKTSTAGDSELQKSKFNDIMAVVADYWYNYKGYNEYPYINNIVRELLERKISDADTDINDLVQKL